MTSHKEAGQISSAQRVALAVPEKCSQRYFAWASTKGLTKQASSLARMVSGPHRTCTGAPLERR
eukprot:2249781-Amphidinium_carterae.2